MIGEAAMISNVANHLWQSSLFACAIGLLTPLLRRYPAAVRHGFWLAASVKFLIPFTLLTGLGSQFKWQKAPVAAPPRLEVVEEIKEPVRILAEPARLLPQRDSNGMPAVLFTVWLCGFAANVWAWRRHWRQAREAVRIASPLPLNLPIPALSSSTRLEPGVFGVLRPILLLPKGLREHLTPTQFEAIVAHELCHIRRRDNLSSAVQMVVEALFWFDPVVWWIRTRLIEERERACDEAVLRMGNDPQDYAEGIVTVCEFYLKSPLACVSGVTGSDLKRRVAAIMLNRVPDGLTLGRKLLLVAAGMLAVVAPMMVGAVNASSAGAAQEPAKPVPELIATSTLPEFQVASIKPSAADSKLKVDFAAGGKLFITNATLRFLIKIAYDIGDDQLAGGPGWLAAKRFDLVATPDRSLGDPKTMAPDQILLFHKPVRLRLQRLLAERFQLQLRRDSAPMPVFALVVAKGGPKKLTPTLSAADPQLNAKPGSGLLNATGMDMATLAKFLSEGQTGRPVVDRTGLKGKYDFRLEWSPDTSLNSLPPDSAANPQPSDPGGISIFTALQQQLGLKLEARTEAADRLVVVQAELPSSN